MLFGTWLSETKTLQEKSYGTNPAALEDQDWLKYVRTQTLAAFVELGEYMQGLKWKPWGKVQQKPDPVDRSLAIRELVDVLHFVANNLIALGCTDQELNDEYERKMQINRDRMERGGH